MNEKELIARLHARDETAFEELIRLYEKKIYALCVRMCGNAEDAEETAQDAFLALWRGIDRFRQESALSTWIYRLASNACIDLMRRRRKSEGGISLDDEALFLDAADPAPQPPQALEQRGIVANTRALIQLGLLAQQIDRAAGAGRRRGQTECRRTGKCAVGLAETARLQRPE